MSEQRYRVIQKLESGGMAEVFLGEATSVQGFKKRVAIKRVLPHLSSHKSFIGMFLDEARLGARLNHANIVSVFDIGSANNTFFIVMEFVDGSNLKKIMETLRKRSQRFPLNAAIYMAMEACRGLSYAHELRDEDGKPMELVHRDVSPPNILISRRGEVKVTDFGLAKARTQLERTDPGVVKGKFSYLSPEAGMGQQVDERADIFALGVCLWEMLAGRRLFLGDTDYETVKQVTQDEVPTLVGEHPEVDAKFEAVLRRALTKDPGKRFQTAREFGDSLAGYLFAHQMKVTSYDIANLVKAALEEEGQSIRPQPMQIDKMIQEELGRFTSLDSPSDDPSLVESAFDFDADGEGARPLDASDFEDPADWFAADSEVASAIQKVRESAPPGATMGWVDSGAHRMPKEPALPQELAQRTGGSMPRAGSGTPPKLATAGADAGKKLGSSVWIVAAAVMAAAAAATAWLILNR